MFPFYIDTDMIDTEENESEKALLIIENFEHQPPYQVMVKECPRFSQNP